MTHLATTTHVSPEPKTFIYSLSPAQNSSLIHVLPPHPCPVTFSVATLLAKLREAVSTQSILRVDQFHQGQAGNQGRMTPTHPMEPAPSPLTWLPLRPIQGSWPYVNISHSVTPNIQVSLA